MDHFVRATEMVNSLGLFSTNEELAEVPTSELRFARFICETFWSMGIPDKLKVTMISIDKRTILETKMMIYPEVQWLTILSRIKIWSFRNNNKFEGIVSKMPWMTY